MKLPFYYSFIEFKKDFNKNFTEWLTHYPNGDIDIFKSEYLKEYNLFYKIEDFTDRIYFRIIINVGINGEEGFEKQYFLSAINEYILNGKENDFITSSERDERVNRFRGIKKLKSNRNPLVDKRIFFEDYDYFVYESIYLKLLTFLELDEYSALVSFKEKEFKDFEYSVIKIVDFLINGEKQTEIQQPQPQPTTQIQPPQNTNTNEFSFINNFDNVEPKTVYEHFFSSLVKKNYITEDTLKNYLITAFQNGQPLNKKITLNNNPTKKEVTAIFYNYYNKIAGKPHGRQNDYIKLLSDNFTGFNEVSLKSNFSKSTY